MNKVYVKKLNDNGMTVINITHYMDEACFASRVVVVSNGEVALDGKPSEVFTNATELKKYGLELPRATYIAEELSSLGVNVKKGILTEKDLLEELCVLFQKG